ncbi:hypothetical protein K502DRAFT_325216 [Neoconidiobolus thromboides FSU 785]|nr:hypothetical protein K502DRAFT_325216 [Neoconidiobolus thromboides FSU 785]
MVYLLIVVILVLLRLSKNINTIQNQGFSTGSDASVKAVKYVKQLGYRIILYPAIMIFTHTGVVVSQTYFDINGTRPLYLKNWSIMGSSLAGSLNFIAFCLDPTIHEAFKSLYYRFVLKKDLNADKDHNEGIYLSGGIDKNSTNHEDGNFNNEDTALKKFIRTL